MENVCLLGTVKSAGFMAVPPAPADLSKTSTDPPHKGMPHGCSVPDGFRKQDLITPKLFLESHSKLKLLISAHSPPLTSLAPSDSSLLKTTQLHFQTLTIWFH